MFVQPPDRDSMLHAQLEGRGIRDPRVLAAMSGVPREWFLPAQLADEAYADRALSIDCGQTISQPYIVALMSAALRLAGHERVLEIGTGSGYQTAILAELARSVISIERHAELSLAAGKVLRRLGCRNVRLIVGDGTLGYPPEAPFDAIVVTAAAGEVPPALWDQLAESGRLVMPVGPEHAQVLQCIVKRDGRPQLEELSQCRFVPLIGEQGREGP